MPEQVITEGDIIAAITAFFDSKDGFKWKNLDERPAVEGVSRRIKASTAPCFDAADNDRYRDIGPFRVYAPKWSPDLCLGQVNSHDLMRSFNLSLNGFTASGATRTVSGVVCRRISVDLRSGPRVFVEDMRHHADADILGVQLAAEG